ncbi:MAG: heme o synthase [Acidiferrobacterales bacterium]
MTTLTATLRRQTADSLRGFYLLCKPRVTALIVFTAAIGALLARPGLPSLAVLLPALAGIALVSGSAAAFNCLIERRIDVVMARTCLRPLPSGQVSARQALVFASALGAIGLLILYTLVNPLTMWLTLLAFVGYAVIYTAFLKNATPMNIVIGGVAGAMPPILGWAAVTGHLAREPLVLFAIIFSWTPPHFWALALYRRDEYAAAGVPMLPVTHGERFTRLHILLYTLILIATSLVPYALGMSGLLYLAVALVLGAGFLQLTVQLYRRYSDALAHRTFVYSIIYLSVLFAALLLDHYLLPGAAALAG